MVRTEQLTQVFRGRSREVRALDDVSLNVRAGEFVVVRGPSGCGKTTLLLALGGMMQPVSGKVFVNETDLYALDGRQRADFRAKHIGFVFQQFHLIPYLNVVDNIVLAEDASDDKDDDWDSRAEAVRLLEQFGLADRMDHRPAELSTGERQRVAIARAMLNNPDLILADEPTGNLDEDNANRVIDDLATFNKQGGTVVLVTHGHVADEQADRVVCFNNGIVV